MRSSPVEVSLPNVGPGYRGETILDRPEIDALLAQADRCS